MFDLELLPASSHRHDAIAPDCRKVEIKLTQGKCVAIRHEPEHLIAMYRPKGGPVRIVYNGPGSIAWNAAGAIQSNGQRPITLTRLDVLDSTVAEASRLPLARPSPV